MNLSMNKYLHLFLYCILGSSSTFGTTLENCSHTLKIEPCCQIDNIKDFVVKPTLRKLDLKKLEMWVARHSQGEAHHLAEAIAKIIRKRGRISRKQFERALFIMGKNLENGLIKSYGLGPLEVVLLHHGKGKSGLWVANYMKEIGAWPKNVTIVANSNANNLESVFQKYTNLPYIFVDNATYSGGQASTVMNYFERTRENFKIENAKLFFGIAYISEIANQKLISSYKEVNLVSGASLKTVVQDINSMEFTDKEQLISLLFKMYPNEGSNYLRYFDHKIPDTFSTLAYRNSTILGDGLVLDEMGRYITDATMQSELRFLDDSKPPYK